MSLLRCAFDRFWGIFVAVLTGAYTLLITIAVVRGEKLSQIIPPIITFSAIFLIIVFILTYILVRLGFLTCKI